MSLKIAASLHTLSLLIDNFCNRLIRSAKLQKRILCYFTWRASSLLKIFHTLLMYHTVSCRSWIIQSYLDVFFCHYVKFL